MRWALCLHISVDFKCRFVRIWRENVCEVALLSNYEYLRLTFNRIDGGIEHCTAQIHPLKSAIFYFANVATVCSYFIGNNIEMIQRINR